ncbi:MAG TPA: YrzI family small protein [Niallia sp.]|nr:YrzI family small protein [Niallia sp.]
MMINMLFFTITISNNQMSEEQFRHQQEIERIMEENKLKQINTIPFI